MQPFVAFFIPSLLGLKLIDILLKEDKKELIFNYVILLSFSMIINNIISFAIFNIPSNIYYHLKELPIFFSKYMVCSIVINILIAFIIIVVKKNCSLELEIEKNETKKKRKTTKNK